ncbi:MAG: hypothetical protein QG619_1667, partial [Pseudomonadota bacterium]|nr:hypothetical protein [Pseudomonadota bacterium]
MMQSDGVANPDFGNWQAFSIL